MDANRLAEEYAKLGSIYDPQASLIQKQIGELPGQYEAQKTALEQAKANAFRDISSAAQARGAFFSGFRPEQMGRYTGEKYLPALASLSSQQQQRQAQLESALQQTQAQRQREATVNLQNIMKLEAAQKAAEAQIAAARAPRYVSGGGGGGGGVAKAPTSAQLKQQAVEDAKFLFKDYTGQQGYTENVVIPQLQVAYPELSAQNIYDIVYPVRKALRGE